MNYAINPLYLNLTISLEAGNGLHDTDRPISVMDARAEAICDVMRAGGREELIHYGGAAHRDDVAWAMCVAWSNDRKATEPELKRRVLGL